MTPTMQEITQRLVESRLEFERTGDEADRDTVLMLAQARERTRQAEARAFARAALEAAEASLVEPAPAKQLGGKRR
jgi:hypothetical protein